MDHTSQTVRGCIPHSGCVKTFPGKCRERETAGTYGSVEFQFVAGIVSVIVGAGWMDVVASGIEKQAASLLTWPPPPVQGRVCVRVGVHALFG